MGIIKSYSSTGLKDVFLHDIARLLNKERPYDMFEEMKSPISKNKMSKLTNFKFIVTGLYQKKLLSQK